MSHPASLRPIARSSTAGRKAGARPSRVVALAFVVALVAGAGFAAAEDVRRTVHENYAPPPKPKADEYPDKVKHVKSDRSRGYRDDDHDGIQNRRDKDDDNDGVPDAMDSD